MADSQRMRHKAPQPHGFERPNTMQEQTEKIRVRYDERERPMQRASNPYEDKRKRHRRTATEIARLFKCPVNDCHKSYGSEGSLN